MHEHLLGYLRDHRDQIIENWLTEVDIPAAPNAEPGCITGIVPLAFYAEAFESVLEVIRTGETPKDTFQSIHLDDFLGVSCACKQRCFGGRVCMELHDAGLQSFMSVFNDDWDADQEFNAIDRECYTDIINHALSGFIAKEIDHCRYKDFRNDCPFVKTTSADANTAS